MEDLPLEILIGIIDFIDWKSLSAIRLVCSTWKSIVDTPKRIKKLLPSLPQGIKHILSDKVFREKKFSIERAYQLVADVWKWQRYILWATEPLHILGVIPDHTGNYLPLLLMRLLKGKHVLYMYYILWAATSTGNYYLSYAVYHSYSLNMYPMNFRDKEMFSDPYLAVITRAQQWKECERLEKCEGTKIQKDLYRNIYYILDREKINADIIEDVLKDTYDTDERKERVVSCPLISVAEKIKIITSTSRWQFRELLISKAISYTGGPSNSDEIIHGRFSMLYYGITSCSEDWKIFRDLSKT